MRYGADREERAKLRTARAVMAPIVRAPVLHDVQHEWSASVSTDGLEAGHVTWTSGELAGGYDTDDYCADNDDEDDGEVDPDPALSSPSRMKGPATTDARGRIVVVGNGGGIRGSRNPPEAKRKHTRVPKVCSEDGHGFTPRTIGKWEPMQPKREYQAAAASSASSTKSVGGGGGAAASSSSAAASRKAKKAKKTNRLEQPSVVFHVVERHGSMPMPPPPPPHQEATSTQVNSAASADVVIVAHASSPPRARAPPPALPLSAAEVGVAGAVAPPQHQSFDRRGWGVALDAHRDVSHAMPPPVPDNESQTWSHSTTAAAAAKSAPSSPAAVARYRGAARGEHSAPAPRRGRRPMGGPDYQAYVCPVGSCGGRCVVPPPPPLTHTHTTITTTTTNTTTTSLACTHLLTHSLKQVCEMHNERWLTILFAFLFPRQPTIRFVCRYRGASGLYYHLRTQHPDYDIKKDGVRKHREAAQ
jgi:hypothetical protein